ncbi:MAG: porin family protein [Gemmatimonadales bacterium]
MIRRSRLALPLLGLLALALAPLRAATAQSISFGITGGASLSTFTGDLAQDAKNYSTYIVGGFARIGALGFAVQPGIYYTGKGAKSKDATEGTVKLNYIQIPLVLRLGLGPIYVGAGPAIGIKVSCKLAAASSGYGSGTDCSDDATVDPVKSTEVSGIVEAGIEFGKFSLGARGDLGLTNAIEAAQSGSTDKLGVKTRTVSAVVAIRF